MTLSGHVFKEIKRKVKVCVIEEGMNPEDCVQEIEKEYELTSRDRLEVQEMAKEIGRRTPEI